MRFTIDRDLQPARYERPEPEPLAP
jgi:hypothetical protein